MADRAIARNAGGNAQRQHGGQQVDLPKTLHMAAGDGEVPGQRAHRQPQAGQCNAAFAGAGAEGGDGEPRTHHHDDQAAECGHQLQHVVRQLVVQEQAHHIQRPHDGANAQRCVGCADAAAGRVHRIRGVLYQLLAHVHHQSRKQPEQQALQQWRKPTTNTCMAPCQIETISSTCSRPFLYAGHHTTVGRGRNVTACGGYALLGTWRPSVARVVFQYVFGSLFQ